MNTFNIFKNEHIDLPGCRLDSWFLFGVNRDTDFINDGQGRKKSS